MDAATLQARVYSGYAKAALRVGLPHTICRPTTAANPTAAPNQIGTTLAAFTVHSSGNFNFDKPSDYSKPTFHALLDGAAVNKGDYLIDVATGLGFFFIAEKSPLVPILAVQCNRTVTFAAPGPSAFVDGSAGYQGTIGEAAVTNETPFLVAWPASVLQGARSVATHFLPGDVGTGMWEVLLPFLAGTNIATGDLMSDDLGNRYCIRTAELTDLGWRLNAQQTEGGALVAFPPVPGFQSTFYLLGF